jgi:MoxR-like ATPase
LASTITAPLRCHLLIGPPASGKTTLARTLAPLLTAPVSRHRKLDQRRHQK